MTKISDEQINKRIAEYDTHYEIYCMSCGHYEVNGCECGKNNWEFPEYVESLDLLVPVVEKLDLGFVLYNIKNVWVAGTLPYQEADMEYLENVFQYKSPSRALARAIYEILEQEART